MENIRQMCADYCKYYKPDIKEYLACRGLLIYRRLVESGRDILYKKYDHPIKKETEKDLIRYLCSSCSYMENDCDFAGNITDALPCGGFIFLGHLIESEIINIDDLKDIE